MRKLGVAAVIVLCAGLRVAMYLLKRAAQAKVAEDAPPESLAPVLTRYFQLALWCKFAFWALIVGTAALLIVHLCTQGRRENQASATGAS